MRGQRSPYTVLGLRPGADRLAVDEAYRHLMKRHHPDLPSGDADQAAEINRAYALLKGKLAPAPRSLLLLDRTGARRERSRRRGHLVGLVLIASAALVMLAVPEPAGAPKTAARPVMGDQPTEAQRLGPDTLDLNAIPDEDAVASAVAAARRLQRDGLIANSAEFSRSCDEDLRMAKSPALLDHCVAFDTATALLGGDQAGARFRTEDMAARHMRAAMRVSNDPVLAEERVGSVRRSVERMLAAPEG